MNETLAKMKEMLDFLVDEYGVSPSNNSFGACVKTAYNYAKGEFEINKEEHKCNCLVCNNTNCKKRK